MINRQKCVISVIDYGRVWLSELFFLIVIFLQQSVAVGAVTEHNANAEYRKGNYQQAIKDYQELLQRSTSAELYYNLGNAYYRSEHLPQAILAYERAHLLNPSNKDIRFNLEFAKNKTIDKISPQPEMIFVVAYKQLRDMANADQWAYASLYALCFLMILTLIYLFASHMWLRKLGFFGGLFTFLVFLVSTFYAYQRWQQEKSHSEAILMAPSAIIRKTPSVNGAENYVIHEGTKMRITDRSLPLWRGIELEDGRTGWIAAQHIEVI